MARLSDGGGGSFKNKGVKRAPAPAPNVRQAQQRDATPPRPAPTIPAPAQRRPNLPAPTQRAPSTIPGPTQRAPTYYAQPAPAYQAPLYHAPAPSYAPPAPSYGGGGFSGGGGMPGGGGGGFEPPAPPPPPPPPRQLNEGEWLAGDADFKDQNNEYDRAMGEFKRRIGDRKKNFQDDAQLSNVATQRNQSTTLQNVGEDFAARGLGYSGLFADRKEKTADSFRNQLANIETVKNRNLGAADEEMADYSSENQLSRGNAKRQALARMAAQQALINAGGAM